MDKYFLKIQREIIADDDNTQFTKQGWKPVFSGSKESRIVIIGQAPGIRAQTSHVPWDDASGKRLRDWLGITPEQFYDEKLVALIPMDFYYPGKGKSGDLPPRKGFAEKWHAKLLDYIDDVDLIILIGQYAQDYYLRDKQKLTDRVKNHSQYDSKVFPLPHPSPRNNIWLRKNDWFESAVLPELKERVAHIFNT